MHTLYENKIKTHNITGFCPPGEQYTTTRTCSICPADTFSKNNGTECIQCRAGYDTNGKIGATECSSKCQF